MDSVGIAESIAMSTLITPDKPKIFFNACLKFRSTISSVQKCDLGNTVKGLFE